MEDIAKSPHYHSTSPNWPQWLCGLVTIAAEFETFQNGQARLAFYLTELSIAKARSQAAAASGNAPSTVVNQFFREVHSMSSDHYHNHGQAGAMGPNSRADGNTFIQQLTEASSSLDLPTLAAELATLRVVLRQQATEVEHDQSVVNVGAAESAAKNSDGPSALKHLKEAGKWALDVATKIGTTVASKAIEEALKIG